MKQSSVEEIIERFGTNIRKAEHLAGEGRYEDALFDLDEARWCIAFLERATREDDTPPRQPPYESSNPALLRRQAE